MKWMGALLLLLLTVGPETGSAMWARMTDSELIQRSDLIVVGEWIGEAQIAIPARQLKLDVGVIAVTEVLKGDKVQTVAFVAVPGRERPVSSSDIVYRKGQRGLWFLRLRGTGEAGIYLADNPQRFLSDNLAAKEIESFRTLLKR